MEGLIRIRHKKGFSIVEIIIILAIVGIMISAIIPLFLNVIQANKASSYYSEAYKIADSLVEEYRSMPFDSLASENFAIAELPGGQANMVVDNNIDGFAQDDIVEIDLTISWDFARSQDVQVVTYITRNGI